MPPTSPCPEPAQLERLLRARAEPWELDGLIGHLEECGRCREIADRLLGGLELVAASAAPPATVGHEPEGEEVRRLVARLRQLPLTELPAQRPAVETPQTLDCTPPPPRGDLPAPDTREACEVLAPPQGPDEIGRLGCYGVLRVLGRGGMGIVFLARQTRPQRLVAVKMILGGRAGREQRARFRSEAEVVARLQHPNIVQIYEIGEHEGRAYFAMEYVSGGSLADQLADAPLPAHTAARLVQTLAGAMQHAHLRGIVHRDLKPSNILLAAGTGPPAEWLPKVTDFGLAKQLEGERDDCSWAARTASGAILGTPGYMAPEQAAGAKEVGPAVDVYALGAILYECLTGRPPFRAATLLETLEQVRKAEPVPPGRLQPGLPRDLQTICLKCLRKEPARRYATVAELADDLGRFLGGEAIRARPVGRVERLWKWARRRPAAAALLAVSAAGLVLLVAGGLVHNTRLREERRRADANYQRAREAVQRMLGQLEDREMGDTPRVRELQRRQCEEALGFYRDILQGQDRASPDVRFDAARAYRQTALAQISVSQFGPARENLEQARTLLEALAAEHPDRLEYQSDLASCYASFSLYDEPEMWQRRALAIREQLVAVHPGVPEWQDDLAESWHNIAQGAQSPRDGTAPHKDRGVPDYRKAVAIRTRLVRDHPENARFRARLAEDYINLGLAYYQSGRRDESISSGREAEALLKQLIREHPQRPEYALNLAALYINWSLALADRPSEALAMRGQAVDLAEEVLRREPQLFEAREKTVIAYAARATSNEEQKHWAEAVKDWDRLLELDKSPQRWTRQVMRAADLARAGDHARAVAEARELEKDPAVSEDGLWILALACARSVEVARSDSRLAAAERDAIAERCAAQAVALLRKLRARGLFQDGETAEQLRTERELGPLRGRADFQKLLREK